MDVNKIFKAVIAKHTTKLDIIVAFLRVVLQSAKFFITRDDYNIMHIQILLVRNGMIYAWYILTTICVLHISMVSSK